MKKTLLYEKLLRQTLTHFTIVELFGSYRLHLPSAILDPLQVDVAEAGSRHPLKTVHVVFVNLHAEDLRVAFDVVPLGVGLQHFLDGGIRKPGGQLRRVDQVVDDALRG